MLINCDVKGLEVVVAAQLSGDKVLSREILDGEDIHGNNQRAFGLGEGKQGRLIAKIFKFRLIYGGSAYSYANDADFMGVSTSEDYWQKVIDAYYEKYRGIASWHRQIVQEAQRNKRLEIPSGRYYPFEPEIKYGKVKWPITKIKNYPVQGFGADLVMLARIEAKKRLQDFPCDFVSTIHDSIVVDTEVRNLDYVAEVLLRSVQEVTRLCKTEFDYDFTLPLTAEVQYGNNKRDMQEYRFT